MIKLAEGAVEYAYHMLIASVFLCLMAAAFATTQFYINWLFN